MKKSRGKISDKQRLDFLEHKTALVTMATTGHFGIYPIGPGSDAEYGVTLRAAIDLAIIARKSKGESRE